MNYQIPHHQWVEQIIARAAGELSPAESATLDKHLQVCPQCAQEAKAFERLANQLHPLQDEMPQRPLPPAVLAYKQEIAQRVGKKVQEKLQQEAETIINQSFDRAYRGEVPTRSNTKRKRPTISFSPWCLGGLTAIIGVTCLVFVTKVSAGVFILLLLLLISLSLLIPLTLMLLFITSTILFARKVSQMQEEHFKQKEMIMKKIRPLYKRQQRQRPSKECQSKV